MSKNKIRELVVCGIVLVVFCLLVFVIPFSRTEVFWVSFGFTLLAIFAQVYIAYSAFHKGKTVRSRFYGWPIEKVGLIYLIVQLIAGFAGMAAATVCPVWVAVVVFVIILAVFGIGLIAVETMRDEIERQDAVMKKDVSCMRNLQTKAAYIASQCGDAETKAALQKLADAFRYSDPVSSEATMGMETDLSAYVEDLQAALLDKDYAGARGVCRKAEELLAERNRMCKVNK